MKNRRLSIFVDESGKFQVPDAISPFYIVGLVFHDQDESIDELVCKLDADAVRPGNYKLFQLADLICTVKLLETKLQNGLPLTVRESKLFGGPRDFRRNILKPLEAKEV